MWITVHSSVLYSVREFQLTDVNPNMYKSFENSEPQSLWPVGRCETSRLFIWINLEAFYFRHDLWTDRIGWYRELDRSRDLPITGSPHRPASDYTLPTALRCITENTSKYMREPLKAVRREYTASVMSSSGAMWFPSGDTARQHWYIHRYTYFYSLELL